MLHTKYKTNSPMRCKNLGFAIPLGSIAALLLLISLFFILPWQGDTTVHAIDNISSSGSSSDNNSDIDIMPTADSPSISLSYSGSSELSGSGSVSDGESSAVVSMSSDITVNATLINSYNLQIASGVSTTESTNPTYLAGPTTIIPIDNTSNPNGISSVEGLVDNTWGYSWNNGSYKGVSNSNVSIESANVGNTNNGTVSFTKPLTFAAKFSKDANAGHYKTKVNLLLTATPKTLTTYSITYNANGGDTSSIPSEQSISNYNDSYTFTIPDTKPTRSGYEFTGWSTTSTSSVAYQPGGSITLQASSPSQTLYAKWNQIYTRTLSFNANNGSGAPNSVSCSSTTTNCSVIIPFTVPTRSGYTFLGWGTSSSATSAAYQPGDSIVLTANTTLYAIWFNLGFTLKSGFNTISYMDQMTSSICSSATIGEYKDLIDRRDNSVYRIVKFKDNKCWMTQNLKIINRTISYADSDITSGSFTVPASSVVGFNNDTRSNAYISGNTGYYTWCAATAGSCSSSGEATASICPKGWKLPTGGTSGNTDFYNLFKNMNLTISNSLATNRNTDWGVGDLAKAQSTPYNFGFAGYVDNGSLNGAAARGGWWSRTAGSSSAAYALYINSSLISPGNLGDSRRYGYAVRCVAQS